MDPLCGGRAEMVVSCVHWLVVGCDASDGMSVSPPTNSSTSQEYIQSSHNCINEQVNCRHNCKCAVHVETSTSQTMLVL